MTTRRMMSRSVKMLGCGALILGLGGAGLSGCTDEPKQVRHTPRPYNKSGGEPVQVETPTVENTEERGEEVRKVCSRKAQTSSDMSRCWMQEAERRGGKKFEAEVRVMLYVSPEGKAQDVTILNSTPALTQLEACIAEAVKGWSYPTGQTVAPAQCSFYLRPIM
jgi:hypothetical protein